MKSFIQTHRTPDTLSYFRIYALQIVRGVLRYWLRHRQLVRRFLLDVVPAFLDHGRAMCRIARAVWHGIMVP